MVLSTTISELVAEIKALILSETAELIVTTAARDKSKARLCAHFPLLLIAARSYFNSKPTN